MNLKISFISIVLVSTILVLVCKPKKEAAQSPSSTTNTTENKVITQTTDVSVSDNNTTNMAQSTHMKNMQSGMIHFAFELFKKQSIENHSESFCVSPVSLSLALGMTYAGAQGVTAKEMSNVLGFPSDRSQFLFQMNEYYSALKTFEGEKNPEFSIANRIYLEQTYILLDDFKKAMTENFGSDFVLVDFLTKFKEVEKEINVWVEQKTRTRIKDLLPKNILDASTVMVLVNAIYFKDDWKFAFDEEETSEMPFYAGERGKLDLMFMKQRLQNIRYCRHSQWQVLELPYNGKNFSMLVILPDQSSSTDIHTRIPDANDYNTIVSSLSNQNVYIELPRFKTESSFMLEGMMSDMGMPSAFSNGADFSGMSGRSDVKISKIVQKVFFEINEKGAEAAAATAVIMTRTTSVEYKPEQLVRFIANRPFIYVLKENTFNTPLFIGQFTGR